MVGSEIYRAIPSQQTWILLCICNKKSIYTLTNIVQSYAVYGHWSCYFFFRKYIYTLFMWFRHCQNELLSNKLYLICWQNFVCIIYMARDRISDSMKSITNMHLTRRSKNADMNDNRAAFSLKQGYILCQILWSWGGGLSQLKKRGKGRECIKYG